MPAANSDNQDSSTCGSVSASRAHAGRAPIAARSLKLTASARCPIEAGGEPWGKCTPSTRVSTAATSSAPAGHSSNAASSPTPTWTSARFAPQPRKYRSMSSNSDSDTRSVLVGTQSARRPIQHRVDVFVAVGGAKAFRQGHRLVDGNAIGHVLPITQLIYTDQQDGVLYGIEQRGSAVEPRGELRIERFARSPDALHQLAEIVMIRPRHVLRIAELLDEVLPGAVVELPAVQRLQCELARNRALAGEGACGRLCGHRRV